MEILKKEYEKLLSEAADKIKEQLNKKLDNDILIFNDSLNSAQKQFEEKFECFDTDLQKNDGVRPWDDKSNEKSIQDLSTSSGEIEAKDKAEEGGR